MRFKNALKKFAYETFRPHSREEYAELFSRGHGGDDSTPYPWFYARVLLFSLLLFTVLCVGYDASKINFLMVAAVGAFFADITFIVLLVEIYPKRDLSLLTPVLVLFAGGIFSSAIIYILYAIANYSAPFADQAWTAFVEETGKAVTTVIILLILKRRNPFVCFIIGAAVGGGYSAFENMWFMYTHGFGWGGGLSQAIETGLWRALGTPFSHAAWAGAFGWALSFEKPWSRWQPYAVYAFNYTMHFFVNFPLMSQFEGWKGYPISAVTGVLSITLIIFLIVKCRRDIVAPYGQGEQTVLPQLSRTYGYPKINGIYANVDQAEYVSDKRTRYKFVANVLAATAIFCFSFTLLGPTCVFGGYVNYKTYYFDNWENVLHIVQGEYDLKPDFGREYELYDDLSKNYSYTFINGELASVTQRDKDINDYCYRYTYGYNVYFIYESEICEDEEGNLFVNINGKDIPVEREEGGLPESVKVWELKSVAVELNDLLYYARTILDYGRYSYTVYSANGQPDTSENVKVYRYFLLTPSVTYVNACGDGTFEVDLRDDIPVRMTESVVFSAVFFAAFTACGIAYIVYKCKIRRLKNAER